MHGGFGGGGGGGFGHSGGGGGHGHSGGGHSSGGHSNSGHSGGHGGGGHQHPMAHDGGHPMHADHHHHSGGSKDDKGGSGTKGQGQSLLSHATSLVQNGHGILGAVAQALSGHSTTGGHGAGAGQSMHMAQYLSPLQAEKKDSSDQVGNPGALSHPDKLNLKGMVSKRAYNEPKIVLAAIFGGLLIWMLVVQVFSGGAPVRHKRMAYNPLQQRSIAAPDMSQDPSVAPLLSILSMAESHSPSSGIMQALKEDPNSDPNEATQTDSSQAPDRDEAKESSDNNGSRYEKEQADLRNETPGDAEKNSDSSAQLAAAMQIFQPRAAAGTGGEASSAMLSAPSSNPVSMRSISHGAPVSARMTARPMGNPHPVTTMTAQAQAQAPAHSNLLQAETLQKSAQETFASGTFGGPRALSADEPILVGAQPKVPGAQSVLRVQKPGSTPASQSLSTPTLSATNTQANPNPTSFASLFVPASDGGSTKNFAAEPLGNTRRRWRASQATAHHTVSSPRNSTIADASIYTNSPVDELGHSRKRVLTDR